MEGLRKAFETAIKGKLEQKATAAQSEEALLTRSFKFFDADNDGAITLNEWCKAIEKIGVIMPSEDLKLLFQVYDLDNDGRINYKELVNIIFASKTPTYFTL